MWALPAVLFLAALVGINANIRLPDPSWAIEVKPDPSVRRSEFIPPLLGDGDASCDKIFSCASCSTSRVCRPKSDGSLTHYTDIPCPDDRPYCDSDSGACLSVATLSCGETDNFVCLEKNHYFPDTNCKQFHYCDEQYKATLFKCIDEGSVYNAAEQRCLPTGNDNTCGKFDCDGNTLKKMKHSNYPRYYAMCKNEENSGTPLVVGVCPPYYQIGLISQVCEPDCDAHGIGNIPDASDCKKYFTCSQIPLLDGKMYMQRTSNSCPEGYSFDTKLFMCVPDPDNTICKKN